MDVVYRRVNVFRKDAESYQSLGLDNYKDDIARCQLLARQNDALGNSLDSYLPDLWEELLIEKKMSLTMIEQTEGSTDPPCLIGFCFSSFIRGGFYREVIKCAADKTLKPRVYTLLYNEHREFNRRNKSPILSRREVAEANASPGEDGLFAYYCVFQNDEIVANSYNVQYFARTINQAVKELYDGYQMQGVMQEAFSLPARQQIPMLGFTVKPYTDYYEGSEVREEHQLFLAYVDLKSLIPGTEAYNNVTLSLPVYGLTRDQQDLMEFMLEGATDKILAQHFNRTEDAIQQRVTVIMQKIRGADPKFPKVDGNLDGNFKRGKRGVLLAFLRNRYNEVRPYYYAFD